MDTKNADKFVCKICDFKCSKPSNLSKHESTRKHLSRMNIEQKNAESKFTCKKCNKEYAARNSLWYHERKCDGGRKIEIMAEPEPSPYLEIINKLLTDNSELRNFIIEQSKITNDLVSKALECKTASNTTINQTNNNNQKFNINVFLNEECKNAINFSEFIKNIEITYEDLENNAQLGFVDGISKIFIDNLNKMEKNERPFHCTDLKRGTMYIKDDDKWTKEPDDKKLQKGIQTISCKSIGKLVKWKEENPDYKNTNSEFSEHCIEIHKNSIAGYDRDVYYPKVIHALARVVLVDK